MFFKYVKKVTTIILILMLLFIVGTFIYINIFHFNYKMNSDLASNVQLARLMWQYKKLVPESWITSSETVFVDPATLGALIYGITQNMNLSMGISCSIMMCIEAVLFYRLCKIVKINNLTSLLSTLMFLVLPGTMTNQENLFLFAAYYSVYIIAILLTLIAYVRLSDENKRINFELVASIILIIFLSLSGVRIALILTTPLFVVVMARLVLNYWVKKTVARIEPNNRTGFIYVSSIFIISLFGFVSPFAVELDSSRNIKHAGEKFLNEIIPAIKEALCLSSQLIAIRVFNYIILFIIILMSIVLAFGYLQKAVNGNDIEAKYTVILFLASSVFLTIFMNTFTTSLTSARYYFIYYLLSAFMMGSLIDMIQSNWVKQFLIYILIVNCVIVMIHYNLPVIRSNDTHEETEQIVNIMHENNCYYGYSSFESAATTSVRSNNRIQIAAIDDFGKMNMCKWLTDKNWYVPNLPENMPTAYLIHENWKDSFEPTLNEYDDIKLIGRTENYLIYYSNINHSNLGD